MNAEKDIEVMESLEVSTPHEINIIHLDHRGRKTTKLVGNTTEYNYIKGQHRKYEIEFKEPIFVSRIKLDTEDYSDGSKANFSCTFSSNGRQSKAQITSAENSWTVPINSFISKFSIEPPRKYLGNQLLKAIKIEGLKPEEFADVTKQVGTIENVRQSILEDCQDRLAQVTDKEAELDNLDQKISDLTETAKNLTQDKSELENEIASTRENFDSVERSVAAKKQELSEQSARAESIVSSIEQKTEERKQLSSQIEQAKSELRELKENINMFPTEISGFVSQGASNIRRYSFLAAIPIIIIGLVTVDLFSKASELSHLANLPDDVTVWEVLIARFPYVLVCSALLASSYKLARVFIAEIIRINEQRLNLTKISIIAKDVSDASEDGLDLDDETRLDHRTHLKMNLLRSHLKGYLAEDHNYSQKKNVNPSRASLEDSHEEDDEA